MIAEARCGYSLQYDVCFNNFIRQGFSRGLNAFGSF